VSRRFNVQVQPQLVLLQKTLLQVEGLGRQLDPDLDLRRTAQPILERWANDQAGPAGFMKQMKDEAPLWAKALPQFPRLVHRILSDDTPQRLEATLEKLVQAQRRQTWMLVAIAAILGLMFLGYALRG
jgi:ubiquinone biosynthesis protein